MNNIEMLESIGFTKNEARTYLALTELGESKTGNLCKKLNIPNSHIYRILENLIKKGIISYKLSNNIKIYKPNPPESLQEIYLKKEHELKEHKKLIHETIKKLGNLPKNKETSSDFKYFEGISGIRSMWLEINDLLIPNTKAEILVSNVETWEELNNFYLEHHKIRAKKKVEERMLLPKNAKKEAKQREKIGHIKTRFLDLNNKAEFGIYQDFMMIQHTDKDNPRGFLIHDKIFAETFKKIFDSLWEQAKFKVK